jgi:hypothetical protein
MTRRCYLHVGSPKTGTTYLQNVLWSSRSALLEQGLMLPLRRIDHFFLTLQLRDRVDPELDPPKAATVLERLGDAVTKERRRGAPRDLLLSHELLSVVTDDGIARLRQILEGYELHVVLTVRDLGRQLPSEWQQFVKTQHRGSFDRFLRRVAEHPEHRFWLGQDFAAIAARWGAGLPTKQVHIVTVPGQGADGSLLDRFCSVLRIDPATLTTDVDAGTPRANPSLGYEQAELLRRVNKALGDRFDRRRAEYADVVKFWFAEQVLAGQDGLPLRLPKAHYAWCLERSEDQIARLEARDYDLVGNLQDLLPAEPHVEGDLTASQRRLLEISLEAMADMLQQRAEDRAQLRRLRPHAIAAQAQQSGGSPPESRAPRWAPRDLARRVAARARTWLARARR